MKSYAEMAASRAHQKRRMNTAQIPGMLNSSVAKRKYLPQNIMCGIPAGWTWPKEPDDPLAPSWLTTRKDLS